MPSSIRCNPRCGKAGLSLVESVTAFAVVMSGVLGAAHLHMKAGTGLREWREDLLAREALSNEIELLRALPFGELQQGEAPFRSDTDALAPLHLFQDRISLRPAGLPGLVEAQVEVSWITGTGRSSTRQIITLIADKTGGGHGGE